jgi:hypothetical protein
MLKIRILESRLKRQKGTRSSKFPKTLLKAPGINHVILRLNPENHGPRIRILVYSFEKIEYKQSRAIRKPGLKPLKSKCL